MILLADCRIRFRRLIRMANLADVDEGTPAKAEITANINDTRAQIKRRLKGSYPRRGLTQKVMSYTANAESVALPPEVKGRMISAVEVISPSASDALSRYQLSPVSIDELQSFETYGDPLVYVVEFNGAIRVRPIPQTATTLYLRCDLEYTPVVADSDPIADWPAEFDEIYALGSAARHLEEVGDDQAGAMRARFEEVFDELKAYYSRLYPDVAARRRY